jgi:hypothetical protein
MAGPGQYLTVQQLGIMPEDGVQQVQKVEKEKPLPGKRVTVAKVQKGTWSHNGPQQTSPNYVAEGYSPYAL